MEMVARTALQRCGVCDESDSMIRFARDRDTDRVVVMIYLSHFDHAAWTMSRHIEDYLIRQFKGAYGIEIHSVHVGVIRARAFKEMPSLKTATSLRAVLRERRQSGVKPTGLTGKRISDETQAGEARSAFPPTGPMGLEPGAPATGSPAAPARRAAQEKIRAAFATEEYLSVPGYEVSEVDFEEFLSSMPSEVRATPEDQGVAAAGAAGSSPGTPGDGSAKPAKPFIPETDLLQRPGPQ